MRLALIICGTLAVILGCIGVFIPGVPTTPFILLASWCFLKSSPRLHKWLNRTFLRVYIEKYERQKGMTRKSKIYTVILIWVMVLTSAFVFIDKVPLRIAVLVFGAIGTLCVIFIVPNAQINE